MAKKSLNNDVKVTTSAIIDQIWGKGVITSNSPENINEEVINVVNDVVNSIKQCSKRMLAVDMTYNIIYSQVNPFFDMVVNAVYDKSHNPLITYVNWFNAIKGNYQYKTCISTAALYHRSRLEMAFMEI